MKAAEGNKLPAARFYQFGPFRLDRAKRLLLSEGEVLPLTPKAFDTLLILVERGGELVTKEELMSALWPDTFVEEGSLTRNISALRKALGENPREHRYIVTIPGQGYRFVAKVTPLAGETGSLTVIEKTRTSIVVTEESSDETAQPIEAGLVVPDAEASERALSPRLIEQAAAATPAQVASPARFKLKPAVIFVAIVLAAIAATTFVMYKLLSSGRRAQDASGPPPEIEITKITATGNLVHGRPAISPDGRFIAYAVADSPRATSLWIRQLATHASEQLIAPSETEYAGITFSRDGNHIYYSAREKNAPFHSLYRIPLVKRPPVKILEHIEGSVAFSPDGSRMVFARYHHARSERSLVVASSDGSNQQEVVTIKHPEFLDEPSWSPDGRVIACGAGHADFGANRYVIQVSVGDWAVKEISPQRWRWVGPVEWLSDGSGLLMIASDHLTSPYQIWHLAYPSGEARRLTNITDSFTRMNLTADSSAIIALQNRQVSNVWVVPVDDASRARRITFGSGGYRSNLCWARDGKIVFESMTAGTRDISIMNADGSDQRQLLAEFTGRAVSNNPSLSPDGRYLFFSSDLTGVRHIWRANSDGSNPVQLTNGGGETMLHCSPDGRWVVYTDISTDRPTIWRVPTDGGEPARLTSAPSKLPAVSPDGNLIACAYDAGQAGWKLAIMSIDGGEPIKIFSQTVERIAAIKWSPDGRSIGYVDNIQDASNVWLQPVDGQPPKQLTQFDGDQIFGFDWSPDGKHLACIRGIWERNLVLVTNFR